MKVKFVKKDVYFSDVAKASLIQRIYFEKANFWKTDWGMVKPNINPLYWCLMDLLKIIYAPILTIVIWPLLIAPVIVNRSIRFRDRYASKDYQGSFVSRAKWMEIER